MSRSKGLGETQGIARQRDEGEGKFPLLHYPWLGNEPLLACFEHTDPGGFLQQA